MPVNSLKRLINNQEDRENVLSQLGITTADLTSATDDFLEGGEILIPTYHSSNVESVGYNPHSKILLVLFRRKIDRPEASPRLYKYYGVDEELYDDLFSAGSPGGTVWERLRRANVPYSRL